MRVDEQPQRIHLVDHHPKQPAGEDSMTRPWTPDTVNEDGSKSLRVKRCCDGCGRPLGDVSGDELEAAIAGAPLPSVVDECGCLPVMEQLALFMHRRDEQEYGTAPWSDLDPAAHEGYRKDAIAAMRALAQLGWAPKGALA
jgi:hypothetical protein